MFKNGACVLRVDFHLPEFCILNSTKKEVIENSINIIEYHYNLLKEMEIKNKVLVLHIGSSVFGKDNSIIRFINNFNKLPNYLKECIVIENDDKIYNIEDCLKINSKTNIIFQVRIYHTQDANLRKWPWEELWDNVLDVGYWGKWHRLSNKFVDYDINSEEMALLPDGKSL